MFFRDLLDLHASYPHDLAHRDILGDGFLLQSNPIYLRVRALSLEIGCEYIEASTLYLLLPFHELKRIAETKKIPFIPGARLMAGVEQSRPDIFSTKDVPIPESYHLHESAHVIAEHFFKDVPLTTPEEKILKIILCESFANTVDALACIPACDEIHRFFIKQNCYMHPRPKVMQAMSNLTEALGFQFTFMLTYFTYVHANFLAKPIGKKTARELANRYARGVKTNAKLLKDMQTVCDIGERLDPNFRVTTTGNYLKLEGFEGEVYDLLDFPFLKVFEKNPGFRKAIEALGAALT